LEQALGSIFKGKAAQKEVQEILDYLTLEDRTNRLSRNVGNCQYTLRNIPEEQRSYSHRGGIPNLRTIYLYHVTAFMIAFGNYFWNAGSLCGMAMKSCRRGRAGNQERDGLRFSVGPQIFVSSAALKPRLIPHSAFYPVDAGVMTSRRETQSAVGIISDIKMRGTIYQLPHTRCLIKHTNNFTFLFYFLYDA
jgi:hypothetical protein